MEKQLKQINPEQAIDSYAKDMEINPEHVSNSLASQIASLSINNAQQNAAIISLNQRNSDLEKDNEILREELKKGVKNGSNK